ncbi:MAG: GNAT family N-acetyltransferase [Thermomicrobiales bacterium]
MSERDGGPVWRRFDPDDDWPALLDLLCACYAADVADMEFYSLNLRATRDAGHSAVALDASGGALAAYGVLWQGRFLASLIHPDIVDDRAYDRLIDWAVDAIERTGPGREYLWPLVRSDDQRSIGMLERRGMTVADTELRMRRGLNDAVESFKPSHGFTIRSMDPEIELNDWLDLYRDAIGDRPRAIERWRRYRDDPDYRRDLDLIAVDREGKLAGACTATIGRLEASCGRKEGRTEPVMIAVAHRGIGLGRALVSAALTALRDAGMEYAALTVEPDNAPAIGLYGSLGFQTVYEAQWYGFSG